MSTPGRPIYTPKQLMKEGLSAGAGKFMMVMFNLGTKPGQFDMMRGGNNRTNPPVVNIDKVLVDEDGTTRIVKVPLQATTQEPDLYLNNPENFNKIEFAEYQGPYHEYPNGAAYTGASFSDDSVPLIPYSKAIEAAERIDHVLSKKKKPLSSEEAQTISETENTDQPVRSPNNTIYFKLTGKRFDRYLNPKFFYPEPTDSDYEKGFIFRYFCQKKNDDSSIIEISKDDFESANTDNTMGLDGGLLILTVIEWTISGPISEARKANDRVLVFAGGTMPKLINYLTDLDEFHKAAGTINATVETGLYTPGAEFLLPNGQVYVGHYHNHPDKGPMVGAQHSLEPHERLIRIRDSEMVRGTGGGGGFR